MLKRGCHCSAGCIIRARAGWHGISVGDGSDCFRYVSTTVTAAIAILSDKNKTEEGKSIATGALFYRRCRALQTTSLFIVLLQQPQQQQHSGRHKSGQSVRPDRAVGLSVPADLVSGVSGWGKPESSGWLVHVWRCAQWWWCPEEGSRVCHT